VHPYCKVLPNFLLSLNPLLYYLMNYIICIKQFFPAGGHDQPIENNCYDSVCWNNNVFDFLLEHKLL